LAVLAVALLTAAVEKPTKPSDDYRNLMRSNAALVDLSAGNGATLGQDLNIELRVQRSAGTRTLRELYQAKEYVEIARQSEVMKANFEKLAAFWTAQKGEDGIALAKRGAEAAAKMHEAALAKSDKDIAIAQSAIERTCRDCHTAHRVIVLTDSSFQIRIAPFVDPVTQ